MSTNETFAATTEAGLQTIQRIATSAFKGIEQLTALNLSTFKAGIDEASATSVAALSVKDPQALLALQSGLLQPAADKLAAYGRQVAEIVAATQSEFEKVSAAQSAEAQKTILGAFEAATKDAPAGTQTGVEFLKTAFAAANGAADAVNKASRQAVAAVEANVAAATASVAKAVPKAKRA